MHLLAAQLVMCIQLETEWQEQMDQFMAICNDDLSLYERLAVYQHNHRVVLRLETAKFLEQHLISTFHRSTFYAGSIRNELCVMTILSQMRCFTTLTQK